MKELKIYRCDICGNMICMIEDSGVNPECCGTGMTLAVPNTKDGAVEKHVPVVRKDGATVQILVGDKPHPMTDQHYISYIFLLTDSNFYMHRLEPGDAPEATFCIPKGEEVIAAYSWCNIHGLWKN